MTLTAFALAALALLATPGPTNTLMALAGAERGWRGALRLVPMELAAYLAVSLPLALAGGPMLAALPVLKPALAGLAGLWVAWLALRLWNLPQPQPAPHLGPIPAAHHVTGRRVAVTTLLNPKALIFGLVLLPGPEIGARLAVFALAIVAVAAVWSAGGACLAGQPDCPKQSRGLHLRRAASLWLALLALSLIGTAASAFAYQIIGPPLP